MPGLLCLSASVMTSAARSVRGLTLQLTSLCPCCRAVLVFLRQAGFAMEKYLGRGVVGMPGVVFQAFTDCVCCPGVPCSGSKPALLFCRWGNADTFRRVLKVSPVAQGQDMGLAFLGALFSRRGAQKLSRGWSRSDEPP